VNSESEMHLHQTEWLIDDAPTGIVFTRKPLIDDGAGGKREDTSFDLPPQKVRVVGVRNDAVFITPEGRRVQIHKRLVGMPGLDVLLGDLFSFEEINYEVIDVQRDPYWRIEVEASRRG